MGKRSTAAAVVDSDSEVPSSGTSVQVEENLMVPFNLIVPDTEFNLRTVYENIDELSEAIAIRHITPLTVVRAADGTFPLVAGYRRRLAMQKLVDTGVWASDRLIRVTIESYESDGARYLANMIENTSREGNDPVDLGRRCHELETGTYRRMMVPLAEGEEPTAGQKYSRKEIAKQSSMTVGHIANLIRVYRNIAPAVVKMCRKNGVPVSKMIAWAGDKGLTETVVDEESGKKTLAPDEAKQTEVFGEWKARQDQEKEEGKPNKRKKAKKGSAAAEREESEGPEPVSKSEIRSQLANLDERIKTEGLEGEDLLVAKTKHKTLRWVLGMITKL
jgi:ParB-like chromosome segregation protein Spo0J